MLVSRINIFSPKNSITNKAFTPQKSSLRSLGGDAFIDFSGSKNPSCDNGTGGDLPELTKALRNDPKHPERSEMSDRRLWYDVAMVDGLTGLNNKRALYFNLAEYIETAKKQGTGISMAMFDMDNFKSVNDLFDHSTGDTFLETIGEELCKTSEKHDCKAYRFGGEEFVMVMPDVNLDAASKIADEIRANINQNPKLQTYQSDYLKRAEKKKAELEQIQQPLIDFKKSFSEYEIRAEDFMKYTRQKDAQHSIRLFLIEKLYPSMDDAKEKFLKLLNHATSLTSSERDKEYLTAKRDSFGRSGEIALECDQELENYLNTHINKEYEIAQIGNWIQHATKLVDGKPQGFTITSGVKEFKDLASYNKKDIAKHLIKETDTLLVKGKKEGRGKVYTA